MKRKNTRARELASVKKTREWLESLGFEVELAERSRTVRRLGPDGRLIEIPVRSDIWGADLVARSRRSLVWIQVKSNRSHVSRGIRGLQEGGWPDCECIQRIVVWWPPRRRVAQGPEVWDVR